MSKPTFLPEPRILSSQQQVATLLDKPQSWFRKNRHELEKNGFPQFDDLLQGWDLDAINLWIDSRSGIERTGVEIAPVPTPASSVNTNIAPVRPANPKVYTVKMAAARLGFSADTVYGLINREELACIRRPNCAIRIKEEQILAYEERFEQLTVSAQDTNDAGPAKANVINRAAAINRMKAKVRIARIVAPKPQK